MKWYGCLFAGLILIITVALMPVSSGLAQSEVSIAILHHQADSVFYKQAAKEIDALLNHRYALEILPVKITGGIDEIKEKLESLMASSDIDIIVALSLDASSVLAQVKSFAKPSIAATIVDRQLQGVVKTKDNTSGIHNFTYIETPFNIKKDLETFKALTDFQHLGVLVNPEDLQLFPDLFGYLGKQLAVVNAKATFSLIEVDTQNPFAAVQQMDPRVDAVYLTPALVNLDAGKRRAFIRQLTDKKLPTFSLTGERDVIEGAMAAIAPNTNFKAVTRRIALNVMKIAEGVDPSELNVQIDTYGDNFVLNMATMQTVGVYPDWKIINLARMIIPDTESGDDALGLKELIALGLEKNLALTVSRYDTQIQQKEVDVARSNRLPQAAISSTARVLDKERAAGNLGDPAPRAWSVTGRLSQNLYSDDVDADIKINALLTESARYQELVDTLDTVSDIVEAYINLLSAKSNYRILNNNLDVTRKNLEIAKIKQAVGYVGSSDVHRWESELARDKIRFNDAYRDVRLAEMALNRLINFPLSQPIVVQGLSMDDSEHLFIEDNRIKTTIRNVKQMQLLTEFLVAEAERQLPEFKQIVATIKAQNRQLKNIQRDFYLPDLELNAQLDKTLEEWGTDFKTPGNLDHPWSVGLTATLPIYSGGRRVHTFNREKLQLKRLRIDERDLKSQLFLRVRSNIEILAVSHNEVTLSQDARDAARKNFEIIQDAYSQGSIGVTDLVDAQNALVQAEQGAVVAEYQMILDIFNLERSVGQFHLLRSPEEKEAFYQRFQESFSQ